MNRYLALLFAVVALTEAKVGELKEYSHGVSGSVFILDDKKLAIQEFYYDGKR